MVQLWCCGLGKILEVQCFEKTQQIQRDAVFSQNAFWPRWLPKTASRVLKIGSVQVKVKGVHALSVSAKMGQTLVSQLAEGRTLLSRKTFVKRQNQAALIEKYRMLGESETFLDCMQRVSRAAKVNRPILIIGERGTGKELVAARLHYLSPRWQQPRITLNCAAFSKDLLEAELFGYEQGAFTGAVRTKPGRFELADQGSMFLDELANSPHALQEKLLRVLEYGEFERVGGVSTLAVDVRVIAATNQDLPTLCRENRFKEDLLDRLSFEVITLPPLRERIEDIPLLASNFAVKMAREMEMDAAPRFSRQAIEMMIDYSWPGNVRELKKHGRARGLSQRR